MTYPPSDPRSNGRGRGCRGCVKVLAIGVGVVTLILAILIGWWVIPRMFTTEADRKLLVEFREIQADAQDAYDTAYPNAQAWLTDLKAALEPTWGNPKADRTIVRCQVQAESDSLSIRTVSYNYVCIISTSLVWDTGTDFDTAATTVAAIQDPRLIGDESQLVDEDSCRLMRMGGEPGIYGAYATDTFDPKHPRCTRAVGNLSDAGTHGLAERVVGDADPLSLLQPGDFAISRVDRFFIAELGCRPEQRGCQAPKLGDFEPPQ